ncbi:hypothetical protein C8R43DRAFT_1193091 [Mycena crocata]|nr:hypothetical protein C8R43DRAFT_1193091 [Mycena crocata]
MSPPPTDIQRAMRGSGQRATADERPQRTTGLFTPAVPIGQRQVNSSGSGSPEPRFGSPPLGIQEPPESLAAELIEMFLSKFSHSGYFFLDSRTFSHSALLAPPIGHPDRPSPTLLNVIYLWGCVLSPIAPNDPYAEENFLNSALRGLPLDLATFVLTPQLVVETIQAEVLLSCYYLHSARLVEGRHHSAAAVTLALEAGLHMLGPTTRPRHEHYPSFPLVQTLLLPPASNQEATERVNAFWAVWILNNYWIAAMGCPSAIPSNIHIDTPWPDAIGGGATISNFLSGNSQDGLSPVALLAKASTMLERIIAFSSPTSGPPDPSTFNSWVKRLQTFQSSLPPLPGSKTLVVTHALTDLAILRLHAPYSQTSETLRTTSIRAAARIVSNLTAVSSDDAIYKINPILGTLCGTVCSFYMSELAVLCNDSRRLGQYQEIDTELRRVIAIMSSVAPSSPVTQHCLASIGQTCGMVAGYM